MFRMLINGERDRKALLAAEARDPGHVLFPTLAEAEKLKRQDFGLHSVVETDQVGGPALEILAATTSLIDYDTMLTQTTPGTIEHDLLATLQRFNVQVGQEIKIGIIPPGYDCNQPKSKVTIEPVILESLQLENGAVKLNLNIEGSSKTITISHSSSWESVAHSLNVSSSTRYTTAKPWLESWAKGGITHHNQLAINWELYEPQRVLVTKRGFIDPYCAPTISFIFK